MAAGACAAADRRGGMAGDQLPAWSSARTCSRRSSPTSTARTGWSPTACCRRADRLQPRISAPDGRRQARRAGTSCISSPSSSAAARTATGGCSATARRRRRAPASRWRTASPRPARLSDIYGEMHVHRLAGFFRRFRDALHGIVDDPDGRVAILTPGPLNETYFEHAYIARYLGFMLLEGEDLTVAERPGDGAHRLRPEAGQRAVAAHRRRLRRSARAQRRNRRSARPASSSALRHGAVTAGQRARLRHPRDPRASSPSCRAFAGRCAARNCSCPTSPPGGAARHRSASMSSTTSTA